MCRTTLEGHFSSCAFCDLAEEDTLFLEVFIKSRGNIKEVEKTLGISYPTVRNKLDSLIKKLGYKEKKKKIQSAAEERRKILEDLEQGAIGTNEALEKLALIKREDA